MTEIANAAVAPTVTPGETPLTVNHSPAVELLQRNHDIDWEAFVPGVYWEHNYRLMRNDDQSIIEVVGEFFSRHFSNSPPVNLLRAIDIGSGANLYPALGMLPWSGTVTLTDISPTNLAWLGAAASGVGVDDPRGRWVWQPFWAEYARYAGYQQLADPRAELAARYQVRQQDVLQLQPAGWDLGTMFFVAESMTSCANEFAAAVEAFLRALIPGAPFAAAFMDSSAGYTIADRFFPAVRSVGVPLIEELLSKLGADATVTRLDVAPDDPVQDGYAGMIVVTGTTSNRPSSQPSS